jgi:hypothetical protein
VPVPTRDFVVASPRASLAKTTCRHLDLHAADARHRCGTMGAAFNFASDNGRLKVRAGTVISFRLGRDIEGVWYDGACGRLSTQLKVDMLRLPADIDPIDTRAALAHDKDRRWKELGQVAVGGTRCGPSIGTADVKVRHQFRRPGLYLVRASVSTKASPLLRPIADATNGILPSCGAKASDEIYVLVRVNSGPIIICPIDPIIDVAPVDTKWTERLRDEVPE